MASRWLLGARALALFLTFAGASPGPVLALDFQVNSTLDQVDVDGLDGICLTAAGTCTLRAAVMQANRSGGMVRILLPAGVFTLTRPPDIANLDDSGDLNFTPNPSAFTHVLGAGASATIVDANHLDRAFRIEGGAGLFDLTVRNGQATLGGGVRVEGLVFMSNTVVQENQAVYGGGIYGGATSSIDLRWSVLRNNQATDGGGLYSGATLSVIASEIRNNSATGVGGGLYVAAGGLFREITVFANSAVGSGGGLYATLGVLLENSTISDNSSNSDGGGLYSDGNSELTSSTVSGNAAAGDGGGIYSSSASPGLRLVTSTLSGNSADGDGGGLALLSGAANLYNVTVLSNRADADADGAGVGGGTYAAVGGAVNVRNNLIANNILFGAPATLNDCDGIVNVYGLTLFGTTSGCDNVIGTGTSLLWNGLAFVGPLAWNGGPSKTHALLPGSNAIDSADPVEGCPGPNGPLTTDQRGAPRTFGSWCDVGAYEAGTLFLDGFGSGDTRSWSTTQP